MLEVLAKVEPETAQGKGSILEVPRDNRGDDSLYLIYTAEELRWILRETGVKSENPEPLLVSPYSTGSGVVLSMANNPDEQTGSRAQIFGGFWDNYANDDYLQKGCVSQCFRRKRIHESVWSHFQDLPEGLHTYALGLGYELEFGWTRFEVFCNEHRVEKGVWCVRKIQIETRPVFKDMEPFIVVFDYDATKRGPDLCFSLRVKIPFMYSCGWFHHIQLVQID